jgi:uncharacterized cupin superfamily protein
MTQASSVPSSSVSATSWEPLLEDGREIGEVHLLVRAEGGPVAGLWRVGAQEGEAFPYRVTGSDSFHVIEGEAELETLDGEKIALVAGGIYSFPDGFTATWRSRGPFLKFFVIA